MRLAIFECRTFLSFRSGLVWCALLSWDATLLGKEAVKDGPAAVATFSHIVTCHDKLNGQIWHVDMLVSVFELHATLDGLDEAVGIA